VARLWELSQIVAVKGNIAITKDSITNVSILNNKDKICVHTLTNKITQNIRLWDHKKIFFSEV